jgi:hypothetical protein
MKLIATRWALVLAMLTATARAQEIKSPYPDLGLEPQDPVGATKRLMLDTLRDPESAQYRFLGIHPAHCKAGWAKRGNEWYGYAATIDINAKNAFGGYTGFASYTILFRDGMAWNAIEGSNFGAYGPSKGLLGLGGGAGVCRYLDH